MGTREKVDALVHRKPGLTAPEISEEIFGIGARQQRVNPYCLELCQSGRLRRTGYGGPGDPFRYYPAEQLKRA